MDQRKEVEKLVNWIPDGEALKTKVRAVVPFNLNLDPVEVLRTNSITVKDAAAELMYVAGQPVVKDGQTDGLRIHSLVTQSVDALYTHNLLVPVLKQSDALLSMEQQFHLAAYCRDSNSKRGPPKIWGAGYAQDVAEFLEESVVADPDAPLVWSDDVESPTYTDLGKPRWQYMNIIGSPAEVKTFLQCQSRRDAWTPMLCNGACRSHKHAHAVFSDYPNLYQDGEANIAVAPPLSAALPFREGRKMDVACAAVAGKMYTASSIMAKKHTGVEPPPIPLSEKEEQAECVVDEGTLNNEVSFKSSSSALEAIREENSITYLRKVLRYAANRHWVVLDDLVSSASGKRKLRAELNALYGNILASSLQSGATLSDLCERISDACKNRPQSERGPVLGWMLARIAAEQTLKQDAVTMKLLSI